MFQLLVGLLALAQPLGFFEAIDLTDEAPRVQAAQRVSRRRSEESEGLSRMTANPTLQVQPGGRRMQAGGRGAELYLGINQRVSLGGLGEKRKVAVAREVAQDAALFELTRRDARLLVARAWLARWTAQEAMLLSEGEQSLALELEQRIAQTVSAGEGTRIDLAAAAAWRAEAALSALTAEGEAFESGVALAEALGRPPQAPQPVLSDLPSIDVPSEMDGSQDVSHVERDPRVQAAQAERTTEQARLDEVKAARSPQLSVGVFGWREGAGDVAAVATFEVEIPVFERGQRERATQAALLARADGAAVEATLMATRDRVLAAHEVEHSGQVLETTESQLVKAAESLAEAQRIRLEAREGTAQEWVQARRLVLKAKLDALRARAAHTYARFVARELSSTRKPSNTDKRP